jgi:hypothetical protein
MIRTRLATVARSSGVALLPALLVLCCAGRADAECGDYVRVLGTEPHPPPGPSPKPADCPCRGLECSGGPKAPAPTPPPAPTPTVKSLPPAPDASAGRPFARRRPPAAAGSPVRLPEPIFHPPRAA